MMFVPKTCFPLPEHFAIEELEVTTSSAKLALSCDVYYKLIQYTTNNLLICVCVDM